MSNLDLIRDALDAFHGSTGLPLAQVDSALHGLQADTTMVELRLPNRCLQFRIECKRKVDRSAVLARMKAGFEGATPDTRHRLLITHYLTPALADDCRRLELNFIDTAGNCHVLDHDLMVFVKGNKVADARGASADYRGGTSASGLRMSFALMSKPQLLAAPYRHIVEAAGIALGSVGWIFRDLEQRGLVTTRDRNKRRHFIDLPKLQQEWAVNYPHKLRPRLNALRFSAAEPSWWESALPQAGDFLWGGEVAASLLDAYLKPATQTLYVKQGRAKDVISRLAGHYRWRADPMGPIEVLDAFWNFEAPASAQGLVPPLLIYSDLLATLDSRAAEAAAIVKKNHLDGSPDSV